ncbi:hypothetical protein HL670_04062 [Serratia plymuthica]|jgi:hypothetical protein|uniref:Uncharacterized protein n=1 Tax=Serratia plymuthica S13 TaxID=1348660 RepID=S4YQD9_SERPL|nr:hypothetical protein SerAS9_1162 [Serratia plymuthica AS9]AEF49254.1 hypothetical protein SerAS12_1162 [Serratia sp. AS12]AEG26961.1 hypothetical protein SerAS13_1162 [Serratia sp. AS13]AGP46871.1 hypothetical protein M621_05960 [Serratia plymuthica S13]ANS41670.1 hypothetical protein Q5A_005940 [Serratia inhibens PRI-2C]KYG16056.1 hypothetical protein SOD10_28020 [Serratia plymuthica]
MFSLPKTAAEVTATLLCLLIVAAFIKVYLFA